MVAARKRIVVAMSGGVDSSAATVLLLEQGFECAGVFMITGDRSDTAQKDAEAVAAKLGIALHVLDLRAQFEHILGYFCDEYARGRTPNPCVVCNRRIKFGHLCDFAQQIDAAFLATGHYARIMMHQGKAGLYQGMDGEKDQSYVLSMVDRNVLGRVVLPMGDHTKAQARHIVHRLGLGLENKDESQEICFIPDDDYVGVLERRRPGLGGQGPIVDSSGKMLGTHNGVHRYTIGQRRGLRVAMGVPYYVTHLEPTSNTVVLGPKEEIMHRRLSATQVNWLVDKPPSPFRATVKIRYNDGGRAATVTPDADAAQVEFDEPNMAITPGQLAVFYLHDAGAQRVAGAGWIDTVGH